MRGHGRFALQFVLLLSASLLDVAGNFAANDVQSGAGRSLVRLALPGVVVLMFVVVMGNLVALRMERPARGRPMWEGDRAPYPGLSAFEEQDAAVFFGREVQIAELVRRLHAADDAAAARFVCVTGSSGSGKSSLVRAGLIPRLRGRRWTVPPVVVPGGRPLHRLASALAGGPGPGADALLAGLRGRDGGAEEIARYTRRSRFGRTLLVVDQLEELLTLSEPADRALFMSALRAALAADRHLRILVTLRVEYLPELLASENADLFATPVMLGALGPADLVAVVQQPAALAGLDFEAGLVAEIVEDTASVDALPLLAYLLQELFFAAGSATGSRREATRSASRETYRELGGVAGALARQADAVFSGLIEEHGPDMVLDVLLQLVSMDGDQPARRRVPLSSLTDPERQVVSAFVNARLLITRTYAGVPVVQAAHEALFRQWPPLRQLVAARAEQLRSRSELERWAADWVRSGRSRDYLLTGARLAMAVRWLDTTNTGGQAGADAEELVAESRGRDRAHLRQVSRNIGDYVLANVHRDPELGILLAAAALAECPPTPSARRALMAALTAHHGEGVLIGHTSTVRAVDWSPNGDWIATASRDGTARIWDASARTSRHILRGHGGMIEDVAWSPDSTRLATASRDRTVRIWNAATAEPIATLEGFGNFAQAVDWSPDGTRLAATCRDGLVRLFATDTWTCARELTGHTNDVWTTRWSADGRRLATGSHDNTVIVWDAATGDRQHVLAGVAARSVLSVDWSPDGTQLVTADLGRRLRLWDARTGKVRDTLDGSPREPVRTVRWSPDGMRLAWGSAQRLTVFDIPGEEFRNLHGHTDVIWSVGWSPDGRRMVTGSEDGTARIWATTARGAETLILDGVTGENDGRRGTAAVSPDGTAIAAGNDKGGLQIHPAGPAAAGVLPYKLTGHADEVTAVRWAPAGDRLATASNDRTIRVWNPAARTHRIALRSPKEVEALAWSPDGRRLAAGSKDAVIRLLDTHDSDSVIELHGHTDWIGALAWSHTGRLLASGSDDRTARIWDTGSGALRQELTGHQNWIDGIAFSPDDAWLATCSADRTIKIWDTTTWTPVHELRGHEARVWAICWSPDGTRLASGSADHTVRVWEPGSGEPGTIIGVHSGAVGVVDWLPDGTRIMSAANDKTIRIWAADLTDTELLAIARRRVSTVLTARQRRSHLLPERVPVSPDRAD